MKNLVKETGSNKMNYQQGMKPYGSIKLTVYGQMVKLTAGGSLNSPESGGTTKCNTNLAFRC